MKKKGEYPGNLTREVKVRVSPELYHEISILSEERQFAIAYIVRECILLGLASRRPAPTIAEVGIPKETSIGTRSH